MKITISCKLKIAKDITWHSQKAMHNWHFWTLKKKEELETHSKTITKNSARNFKTATTIILLFKDFLRRYFFFAYLLLLEQTLSLDSSKERKRKYRLVQDLTTRGQPYQLSQIGTSTWAPSSGHSWKLSQCSKVKGMVNLPRKKETISHHESFVLFKKSGRVQW